ncbi:WbqC family protein [Thermosipho ferrireducens]|uniref:WbqC family protein n=1 Tax=Thermosipho ferrireducens TaxID=2571116 RepID=A0ABX7S9T2_9BACT|nr:WbqC family protein [Thermosipho ferrireducens]QTA38635.1 WbqC family protein [Thermosipho ferrireducens]
MSRIAILQPNYLPWKGVFDMINRVDIFVFLDNVQYTKHDWRNRNYIKTPNGKQLIVVPVKNNSIKQLIKDVMVSDKVNWQRKHYNSFIANYSKAPYFKDFKWMLEDFYVKQQWVYLSELNIYTTRVICEVLGIKKTEFVKASELEIQNADKNLRLINIIKALGGKEYLSGPAAKDYLDLELFAKNEIKVEFMNYKYPVYPQLYGNFLHEVTVLDVIFNCGKNAKNYIFLE